ncbi:Lactose regulatory protein LAC9 [Smittium mucronatum]|uniref:Lactose regulatory protein LAC9 n=1 Tax=Smittium mucronatum TaxID=133383 RepID=A0A1R0H4L0_9FUNG|nr:Lactose regulatory protein LAC9 [Smittium mucronatum]
MDTDINNALDFQDPNDDNDSSSNESKQSDTETTVKLMRACDTCRRKKIKCDGNKPSCSNCSRLKQDCVYSPLIRKKKVRKTAIQKIEGRLDSVEQVLVNLAASVDFDENDAENFNSKDQSNGTVEQFGLDNTTFDSDLLDSFESSYNNKSLRFNNFSEIEMLKNEFIELVLGKIMTNIPLLTFFFRLPYIQNQIKTKSLPEHLIYSIFAVGLRFVDSSELGLPFIHNSVFAARSSKIISEILEETDINFIMSAILLVLYYWSSGNCEFAMVYLATNLSYFLYCCNLDDLGIAIRGAERHRLYQIDEHYCGFKRVFKRDWEDKEFKRRVWWACYIIDRSMMINSALPPSVPDDDIVVDMPSCDYAWKYTEQELNGKDSVFFQEDVRSVVASSHEIPDSLWMICSIYTVIGKICQFANRRRINYQQTEFYSFESPEILDNKNSLFMLATELGEIKSTIIDKHELISPNTVGFPSNSDDHTSDGMKEVYVNYFTLHLMYEASKIILFRSELVRYDHEEVSNERIITAKRICLESSLQLTNFLQWAFDNIPVNLWDSQTSFWAFTAGTILINCQFLHDYQYPENFKKGLGTVYEALTRQGKYYKIAYLYLGVIQELSKRRDMQLKSKKSDIFLSKIQSMPCLTPSDTLPWLVFTSSSLDFTFSNIEKLSEILDNDDDLISNIIENTPELYKTLTGNTIDTGSNLQIQNGYNNVSDSQTKDDFMKIFSDNDMSKKNTFTGSNDGFSMDRSDNHVGFGNYMFNKNDQNVNNSNPIGVDDTNVINHMMSIPKSIKDPFSAIHNSNQPSVGVYNPITIQTNQQIINSLSGRDMTSGFINQDSGQSEKKRKIDDANADISMSNGVHDLSGAFNSSGNVFMDGHSVSGASNGYQNSFGVLGSSQAVGLNDSNVMSNQVRPIDSSSRGFVPTADKLNSDQKRFDTPNSHSSFENHLSQVSEGLSGSKLLDEGQSQRRYPVGQGSNNNMHTNSMINGNDDPARLAYSGQNPRNSSIKQQSGLQSSGYDGFGGRSGNGLDGNGSRKFSNLPQVGGNRQLNDGFPQNQSNYFTDSNKMGYIPNIPRNDLSGTDAISPGYSQGISSNLNDKNLDTGARPSLGFSATNINTNNFDEHASGRIKINDNMQYNQFNFLNNDSGSTFDQMSLQLPRTSNAQYDYKFPDQEKQHIQNQNNQQRQQQLKLGGNYSGPYQGGLNEGYNFNQESIFGFSDSLSAMANPRFGQSQTQSQNLSQYHGQTNHHSSSVSPNDSNMDNQKKIFDSFLYPKKD